MRHGIAIACICTVFACSDEGTGLRVKLVADPDLNSETEVVQILTEMDLILDAANPFPTNLSGTNFTLADVDNDGVQELVLTTDVSAASEFPRYRLLPGDVSGPFTIRAIGRAAGDVAAEGPPTEVNFVAGEDNEVIVKFDLRAAFRAPRVSATLPADDSQDVPTRLDAIRVFFSKELPVQDLSALSLHLVEPGGAKTKVAGTWVLEPFQEDRLGEQVTRSVARLSLDCDLAPGSYQIDVVAEGDAPIVDFAGKPLARAFSSTFEVPGTPANEPCQATSFCISDDQCNFTELVAYDCVQQIPGEGRCRPRPTQCALLECAAGQVCQLNGQGYAVCSATQGQITIVGLIERDNFGTPIPVEGATVELIGSSNEKTVSDAQGKFSLNVPENSANFFRVSKAGHTPTLKGLVTGPASEAGDPGSINVVIPLLGDDLPTIYSATIQLATYDPSKGQMLVQVGPPLGGLPAGGEGADIPGPSFLYEDSAVLQIDNSWRSDTRLTATDARFIVFQNVMPGSVLLTPHSSAAFICSLPPNLSIYPIEPATLTAVDLICFPKGP